MDDLPAAQRIRADEIDILIDLNGLTRGARLGVLRLKPAPVQITYLGYIGPVPLPELDYMLCDEITVPPEHDALYSPRPLRLPGCFQANDSREPLLPPVSRADEGLPEGAFVFACFSHHYKITETVFAAWCRILAEVPGAVLWLTDDNPQSQAALRSRAQFAGLDPARLIFAARVAPARYRARLALADLFLDTTPYNAGTVASDALRMGLPVLTQLGKSFAARMAASLLTRIGLTDCIAKDAEDYVALAVAIARTPHRHAGLRQRLADGVWQRTLGDVEGFTRTLEAALLSVRLQG
jgi:predicted O-linked N-acetylglucosamine transferase (SPINDLY family)